MQKNSLITDEELATLFAGQFNNGYKPADIANIKALIESFGRFATRKYDREFVASAVPKSLSALVDVLPPVQPQVLSPEETLGTIKGEKSSGYLCDGTKMAFISNYPVQLKALMREPTAVLPCVPIQVLKPKEEIRDVTKAPRDLSFPPVWFMVFTAMYEKDFFLCNMEAWPNSPIKVGIPMPQGWPFLVHSLTRFGMKGFVSWFFEWDAKQYDRSHPIELTKFWYHVLNHYYAFVELFGEMSDEWLRLFYVMFWSCFRLVLLPDGRIVLVMAGIYSGDVSTTNKNSVFHVMRLAICWIHIFGTLNGFRNFCRISGLALFGDDGVCAAHNERHFYFLNNLPAAWETCFGAELKVHKSTSISGVSFLGKRSLGDDHLTRTIPVSSDLERQICSLVHKTKPNQDPIQRLSKLVAHRELLCGYAYIQQARAPKEVEPSNTKGARLLELVDAAIKIHVARYQSFFANSTEWTGLLIAISTPPKEVVARFLAGRDSLDSETKRVRVYPHSTHSCIELLSTPRSAVLLQGSLSEMVKNNGQAQRRAGKTKGPKNPPTPPSNRSKASAPAPRRPRRKAGTSHESTGNVLGKIAGSAASAIPIVGPVLGPLAESIVGGLTGGVSNARWSGNGAVKIEENTLLNKKTGTLTKVIDGQDGWTKFKYVEVLGNVISAPVPGAFFKEAFRVNPADEETFEWLGPACEGYSQYKIAGMWVELSTQTSVVAPDGGSNLGRWGVAGQYNPALQDGFATLNQCLQADGGQNGPVSQDIQWAAECKPRDSNYAAGLYTSGGPPPEGMNYAQTDPFVVVVFGDGVQIANAVLGIAKCHYEFWCCKKTLTPSSTSNVADIFAGETDIQEEGPFGVEIVACATNTIGGTLTNELIDTEGGPEYGSVYRFPKGISGGRYMLVVQQSQMGSSANYTTGTMHVGGENCTIIPDVLQPDGVAAWPNSKLVAINSTSVMGPSAGVTTGTPLSGVGIATQYTLFVDITRGGAAVQFIWNGVTADSLPISAGLTVVSFPKAVTFNPPDTTAKVLFRNGPALNRLAASLETVETHKEVARIVKDMRCSLAASGKSNRDIDLLRNIHKKTHRDLLKRYDFGRVPEDNSLQKQIDFLTAMLLKQTQPQPPQILAPHPVRAESETESETDDEHELEREVRSLRRQIESLQKAEKKAAKARQPAGSQPKASMSYSLTPSVAADVMDHPTPGFVLELSHAQSTDAVTTQDIPKSRVQT